MSTEPSVPSSIEIPIQQDVLNAWAAHAITSRVLALVVSKVGAPESGSALAALDARFPEEKCSVWMRQILESGIEHLITWANLVSPLQHFEGAENRNPTRPYYTLARAAIEASAQVGYVLNAPDGGDSLLLHLRMVRHDLWENERGLRIAGDTGAADEARTRLTDLREASKELISHTELKDELRLVKMIRGAARAAGRDPDAYEALWRLASAAAHGKSWYTSVAHYVDPAFEWKSGRYVRASIPDINRLTEMVGMSTWLTEWAVRSFTLDSGEDFDSLRLIALADVIKMSPVVDGQRDEMWRLAANYRRRGEVARRGRP